MWIRIHTHLRFWLFFSLLFLVRAGLVPALSPSPDRGRPPGSPVPENLESNFRQGFHALYSMDYSQAKKEFEQMTRLEPKHPSGYIYLASAIWLEHLSKLRRLQSQIYNRNNAFFQTSQDAVDPEVEKLFYRNIEKGM